MALVLLLAWPATARAQDFFKLVETGTPAQIQEAFEADPSLLDTVEAGRTALHVAAARGDVDILQMLLDQRLSVTGGGSWTPLHEAALNGNYEAARLLLRAGAPVNAREASNGGTPLHVAAFNGHLKVVQLLLASGAKVNARDRDGWTALSQARDQGFPEVEAALKKNGGTR